MRVRGWNKNESINHKEVTIEAENVIPLIEEHEVLKKKKAWDRTIKMSR